MISQVFYLILAGDFQEFNKFFVLNNLKKEEEKVTFNDEGHSLVQFAAFCGSFNVLKIMTLNKIIVVLKTIRWMVQGGGD